MYVFSKIHQIEISSEPYNHFNFDYAEQVAKLSIARSYLMQ